jgi:hypothetical protein
VVEVGGAGGGDDAGDLTGLGEGEGAGAPCTWRAAGVVGELAPGVAVADVEVEGFRGRVAGVVGEGEGEAGELVGGVDVAVAGAVVIGGGAVELGVFDGLDAVHVDVDRLRARAALIVGEGDREVTGDGRGVFGRLRVEGELGDVEVRVDAVEVEAGEGVDLGLGRVLVADVDGRDTASGGGVAGLDNADVETVGDDGRAVHVGADCDLGCPAGRGARREHDADAGEGAIVSGRAVGGDGDAGCYPRVL